MSSEGARRVAIQGERGAFSHQAALEALGVSSEVVPRGTFDELFAAVAEGLADDFESGRVTELYRKEGPFQHWWLAVSPDEEWVLYSETPAHTSELMLVENFR